MTTVPGRCRRGSGLARSCRPETRTSAAANELATPQLPASRFSGRLVPVVRGTRVRHGRSARSVTGDRHRALARVGSREDVPIERERRMSGLESRLPSDRLSTTRTAARKDCSGGRIPVGRGLALPMPGRSPSGGEAVGDPDPAVTKQSLSMVIRVQEVLLDRSTSHDKLLCCVSRPSV